jgi:predicted HAD superfamily Cof-like phosphohydrolase
MSTNWYADVLKFHKAFGLTIHDKPQIPSHDDIVLRAVVARDEFDDEYLPALLNGDIKHIADDGIDLIYFIIGTFITYGIDPQPIWDAVQAANFAKLPPDGIPVKDQYGKIMKPEGWKPPDITKLLHDQGSLDPPPLDSPIRLT